jgi:hypothetical protein
MGGRASLELRKISPPLLIPLINRNRLGGAEHGRRVHVPAGPISSDRNAINCPRLPLPLVPARDRDRARAQRSL